LSPEKDGDTEQKILDAAHAVFLRQGTAGARMQEIADEAGVNKALLHYYFRSKDRLAEAVFRKVAVQLLPPVAMVLASGMTLEEKVARVVEIELGELSRSPFLPGYLISELNHNPERAHQLVTVVLGERPENLRPKVFEVLRGQIEDAVRAGRMVAIEPEQFVINLISLCIFPFAARPMIKVIAGVDEAGFAVIIARRREELVPFFLRALRP